MRVDHSLFSVNKTKTSQFLNFKGVCLLYVTTKIYFTTFLGIVFCYIECDQHNKLRNTNYFISCERHSPEILIQFSIKEVVFKSILYLQGRS